MNDEDTIKRIELLVKERDRVAERVKELEVELRVLSLYWRRLIIEIYKRKSNLMAIQYGNVPPYPRDDIEEVPIVGDKAHG